ncbi:MAG: phage tail protein [Oscillospiraceae bacterium]
MSFYHGVKVSEYVSSVAAPSITSCGIPFVVGAAPVQTVGGKANIPILCKTYAEATAALGYSDEWTNYPLCEVMYSHFKLYGMSPVIFLNVLDPATMKSPVAAAEKVLANKQVKLPIETIASSVVVKTTGGTGAALVKGTDYSLLYCGENLIIEVLPGGTAYSATAINVAYDAVTPTAVTATQIIGGYDTGTQKTTGLECINQSLAMFGVVPDLILAPGMSHNSTVAAAMAAKAAGINGIFTAKALIDVDCSTTGADFYSEVEAWKTANSITDKNQILCWPMVQLDGKTFHLSTHLAGLIAKTDNGNGCPYESPSNKPLEIDAIVTDGGNGNFNDVILDITAANVLNADGVVTALNMLSGFTLWGNYTAAYPKSAEPKDTFICVSRMFSYVDTQLVKKLWSKIDRPMTRLLVDSIVDDANYWLIGLVSDGKLYGGRVEFLASENSIESLTSGKITLHIYLASPFPGQMIEFIREYDSSYVKTALA